jgi:hypothetical protein
MAEAGEATPQEDFSQFEIVGEGAAESTEEDFSEFELVEPSGEEKVRAVGQGIVGGLAETAPFISGALMGGAIGGLGGPVAPATVPAGIVIGGAAGWMAGRASREQYSKIELPSGAPLTFNHLDDLPPPLRPYGLGGEVIGSGVPFAGATGALALGGQRLAPSFVGNFINRMLDAARDFPRIFAISEGVGILGAAAGEGIAETIDPGSLSSRFAGGVIGGIIVPGRLITTFSSYIMKRGRGILQAISPAARETEAARVLQDIFATAGEDPVLFAQLLRNSKLDGIEQTGAQMTGSESLIALETALLESSGSFGVEAGKKAVAALDALKGMIGLLRGTGDPAALKMAAELRSRYFRTLLTEKMQIVEREAAEAASAITEDSPADVAILGKNAANAARKALRDSRDEETVLWNNVAKNIVARVDSIVARYASLRATMLPEDVVPGVIEKFFKRMDETEGITTTGELIILRSRYLELAREADNANDKRIFGALAEAALDDLDAVFKRDVPRPEYFGDEAYDIARAFSFELHEVFTRSFTGRALATTKRGDAIPPELLVERAFGAGKTGGALRLQELEEATRFLPSQDLGGPEAVETLDIMLDAQKRLIRLAAAEAMDKTGRVNVDALKRFIHKNEILMERFPEVKADLEAAISSRTALADIERIVSNASKVIEQRAAFAKIAATESPIDVVRSAVSGKEPLRALADLAKTAKRGGEDAVAGLRATVFDHLLRESGGDFTKLRSLMFDPLRPGKPSMAELMRRGGVLDDDGIERLITILDRADNILAAQRGGGAVDLTDQVDALTDLVTRVSGAKLATKAVGPSGGASLIVASAGSQLIRRVLDRIPNQKIKDVLVEAANNPEFMAMLLEKPVGQPQRIKAAKELYSFLVRMGAVLVTPLEVATFTSIPDAPEGPRPVALRAPQFSATPPGKASQSWPLRPGLSESLRSRSSPPVAESILDTARPFGADTPLPPGKGDRPPYL